MPASLFGSISERSVVSGEEAAPLARQTFGTIDSGGELDVVV